MVNVLQMETVMGQALCQMIASASVEELEWYYIQAVSYTRCYFSNTPYYHTRMHSLEEAHIRLYKELLVKEIVAKC